MCESVAARSTCLLLGSAEGQKHTLLLTEAACNAFIEMLLCSCIFVNLSQQKELSVLITAALIPTFLVSVFLYVTSKAALLNFLDFCGM